MLRKRGMWFHYSEKPTDRRTEQVSILGFNSGGDGFSEKEANEIGPQLLEASKRALERGRYYHVKVSCGDEEFYVCVDSCGGVKLPRVNVGNEFKPGKTLDRSLIPSFSPI